MTARLRRGLRLAIPAACCAAFAVGLTAQGACLPYGGGSGVVSPPATVALATHYVLVGGDTQPLPRVVRQDPDGTITRVFADTLTLTPGGTAPGTFDEIAVVGVTRPGQTEVVTRSTAAGVAYTRVTFNTVQFASLAGLPVSAAARAPVGGPVTTRTGGTSILVNLPPRTFDYESR